MIRFLYPQILWALLFLPLLTFWWGKQGRAGSILFSSTNIARLVGSPRRSAAGWAGMFLRLLAVAFLIVGLARPQLGRVSTEVEASGIDIILAVDCSGSMQTLDYNLQGEPASRLDVVKSVVTKFVDERPNDRIGLVAFSAYPYLVCPLTLDHSWLEQRLDTLQAGQFEDGTAIGSGVASSINRLRDQKSKSRIVILLTDGMNNRGKISPLAAAETAAALGVKVYTIGAGSNGEAMVPVDNGFGGKVMAPIKVEIDENVLREIADKTGARYFRAADTEAMKRIYEQINQMETTKHTAPKFENFRELFDLAVIPGLSLLFLELVLSEGLVRRLP